jgi:hypothetical protein
MKADTIIEFRKPVSIQQMSCTMCGAQADASCNCGAPYLPASKRAAAVAAKPESEGKTVRELAEEAGVGLGTMHRALVPNGTTDEPVVNEGDLDEETKLAASGLATQYRKHTQAHTTHLALAKKDIHRAGSVLTELKVLIESTGLDWWSFYTKHFDKPRKYAEQAMRLIEEEA